MVCCVPDIGKVMKAFEVQAFPLTFNSSVFVWVVSNVGVYNGFS